MKILSINYIPLNIFSQKSKLSKKIELIIISIILNKCFFIYTKCKILVYTLSEVLQEGEAI